MRINGSIAISVELHAFDRKYPEMFSDFEFSVYSLVTGVNISNATFARDWSCKNNSFAL